MQHNIDSSVLEYLKSVTLLCVEDNKTTQLIYASIFEDLVEKIIFAYDGEDGYNKFCDEPVDLIISDYGMPLLNGIEMIKKIRDIDRNIPIILVSSIEDMDVIVEALKLNVNNFFKKPIVSVDVMQAIENVSKLLIANNYLKEQRDNKIKEFQEKEEYNSYQEDLAFSKELNILKNDFYYQMIDMDCMALIDFLYRPLDVLSGDAYSARRINEHKAFYLIVDGMGKGLSASLSSMIMTSYVNHVVDKMNIENCFDLNQLIELSIEYIKPILLEEEALAVDFITINSKELTLEYAKFAMPSIIMQTTENKIVKLKSNNPPISKYIKDFKVSLYETSSILKFLFYSDGIVENDTVVEGKQYIEFIEDDFLNSFCKEEMVETFSARINTQEDDFTLIFIHQFQLNNNILITKTFQSTLEAVEEANDWYTNIWKDICGNNKTVYNACVVFSELFMNAFEHGNLGLDTETKHTLLGEDTYFTTLEEMQKNCTKKIIVRVNTIEYNSNKYILTHIIDEGDGFNTQLLAELFKQTNTFNGRGVFISKKSSMGIYYNSLGNAVLSLHKV